MGVGGNAVPCPRAGGSVSVTGYSGQITCPSYEDVCGGVNAVVPPGMRIVHCFILFDALMICYVCILYGDIYLTCCLST